MNTSDWLVIALNVAALLMAVAGLAAQHLDPMSMALSLSIVTALVNGGVLLRRGRRADPAPVRASTDELDAHTVLDLDARLEALERAHADAADAARWRALVESGQIVGPGLEAPTGDVRGHTRNGHREA